MNCSRELIQRYVRNALRGDDLLDFLLHVDSCPNCQNSVFLARQHQDAPFYQKKAKSLAKHSSTRKQKKAS